MREQVALLSTSGAKRRSTRISLTVPVLVTGVSRQQEAFAEKIETVTISCHGFHYFSSHQHPKRAVVNAQLILNDKVNATSAHTYRGCVIWSRKSPRLGGLYLVGVEFETPRNIWNLDSSPDDWTAFAPAIAEDPSAFLAEVDRILQSVAVASHYQLLGVDPRASHSEVKRHFYQLARRFHPDHHMNHPEWTPRLLALMDSLATAYRTLSDDETKKQYDSSLARAAEEKPFGPGKTAQVYLEKALECMAEKNFSGCILWLHRAIEYEPSSSSHRAMLGRCLSAIPEYHREAVEQFELSIDLDPRNAAARLHYGELLEHLRAPWKAKFQYARALEIDPNNREARDRLTRLGVSMPRSSSKISLLGRLTGRR
jgi:curved DNA-binding protein CbpA